MLHDRPDDRQTTGFGGKGVNLIDTLAHEASQAFVENTNYSPLPAHKFASP